ncbi:unnamed protein product [Camellia sinensis]
MHALGFYRGSTTIGYLFPGILTSVGQTESSFSRALHLQWSDQVMNEDRNFKLGKVDSGTHTWSATKPKKAERF